MFKERMGTQIDENNRLLQPELSLQKGSDITEKRKCCFNYTSIKYTYTGEQKQVLDSKQCLCEVIFWTQIHNLKNPQNKTSSFKLQWKCLYSHGKVTFNLNYSHSDSSACTHHHRRWKLNNELKSRNLPTSLSPVKVLSVVHIADLLQAQFCS